MKGGKVQPPIVSSSNWISLACLGPYVLAYCINLVINDIIDFDKMKKINNEKGTNSHSIQTLVNVLLIVNPTHIYFEFIVKW